MKVIGTIADHPTPKVQSGGGAMYTLNSRDYKGAMIVIINSSGGGISGTIDANYYKGQGIRQGIKREFVVEIEDDIPKDNRPTDGKQPSGQLLRTGRIQ